MPRGFRFRGVRPLFHFDALSLQGQGLIAGAEAFATVREAATRTWDEALERAMTILREYRKQGFNTAIDDFGAGFSSLQRLCQLPFNEIKLDADFIRNLAHEPRCRAAISSTLALGETLGMSVVIEGIETDAQRRELLALGCTQGQGYWYARPMAGADLLNWLQQRNHRRDSDE